MKASEAATGKVVYITGASSGIGAEVAKEFSRRGYRVALSARRTEKLKEVADAIESEGGEVITLPADVTSKESLDKAISSCLTRWGQIDVVYANAGFSVVGLFNRLTVDDYRRQFETNVFGVLNTVESAKEALSASKGILAITGSISGQVSFPGMTPYAMSKFAVRAFAQGLRAEWKRKGISVVLISPGFVESEIYYVDNEGKFRTDFKNKSAPSRFVVPLAKAAPQIVKGILSRRSEVIVTGHAKALSAATRLSPELFQFAVENFFSWGKK